MTIDQIASANSARISVWMGGVDGSVWLSRDADAVHHPASTMKLPLLVALHRAADSGELDLGEEVLVRDTLLSVVPGQTYLTTQDYDQDDEVWDRVGSTTSLRWLGERAIIRSSNLATNLLIDRVGVDAVNAVYDDFGTSASRLARGIQDAPGAEAGLDSTATASDLAAVMCAVAARTAASPAACERIEAVLAQCEDNDGVPAGLPEGVYTAHKPGWIEGVCHDVALVRPDAEEPFVLAVLTGAALDGAAGFRLVAEVAAACWHDRHALAVRSPQLLS